MLQIIKYVLPFGIHINILTGGRIEATVTKILEFDYFHEETFLEMFCLKFIWEGHKYEKTSQLIQFFFIKTFQGLYPYMLGPLLSTKHDINFACIMRWLDSLFSVKRDQNTVGLASLQNIIKLAKQSL